LSQDEEKKIRVSVISAVFQLWPNATLDENKAEKCEYALIDQCSFWYKILHVVFRTQATKWQNDYEISDSVSGVIRHEILE
jgi:hypothetical protein